MNKNNDSFESVEKLLHKNWSLSLKNKCNIVFINAKDYKKPSKIINQFIKNNVTSDVIIFKNNRFRLNH